MNPSFPTSLLSWHHPTPGVAAPNRWSATLHHCGSQSSERGGISQRGGVREWQRWCGVVASRHHEYGVTPVVANGKEQQLVDISVGCGWGAPNAPIWCYNTSSVGIASAVVLWWMMEEGSCFTVGTLVLGVVRRNTRNIQRYVLHHLKSWPSSATNPC
jgi:hypothetical protein